MASSLTGLPAHDLARRIATRAVSGAEVMTAFLDHIDRVNPVVNAIISRVDRATLLAEATRLDAELMARGPRGPLHGLPIAIKDLEETAGIPTTYGSPLFRDHVPTEDSLMVARLKAAGAIVIGKTNVPEFGYGSQSYNTLFGTTLNAYDQSRTAGGSSGGAAVALATHMLPLADGSDHGGSLRNPAAFNNVYGFRPSPGRIPERDAEIFGLGLPVLGPMARSVEDLALLFSVQAGPDPQQPLSLPDAGSTFEALDPAEVKGKRIGWLGDLDGHLPIEPGILALCEEALRVFEGLGAVVEPATLGFPMETIWTAWKRLRSSGILARHAEAYRDPARRDLLKRDAQWEIEQAMALSAEDIAVATSQRSAWARQAMALFERYDALVLPSAQVFPFAADLHWPATVAGRAMDSYHRWMEVVTPATLAGLPSLNVPVGFGPEGLPMGMQLIGPFRGDRDILRLGLAYDQATRWPEKRHSPLAA